jgi:hypothetical protein
MLRRRCRVRPPVLERARSSDRRARARQSARPGPFNTGAGGSGEGTGGLVGAGGGVTPVGKGGSVPLRRRDAVRHRGRASGGHGRQAAWRPRVCVAATGALREPQGGRHGTGGMSGPPMCATTERFGGGVCAQPSPKVGCGTTGCEPCHDGPTRTATSRVSARARSIASGFRRTVWLARSAAFHGRRLCPNSPIGCPDCGAIFGPGAAPKQVRLLPIPDHRHPGLHLAARVGASRGGAQ